MRSPLNAILRLAESRGHGSTICVTWSVATALPALSETASRRSRYSEQPASNAASAAPSARVRSALIDGNIGPPRHVEHMPGERPGLGARDGRRHRQLLGFGP